MYQDQSAIANPELQPWVLFLSGLSQNQIQEYINKPAIEAPAEARALLEKHEWATAARAICMRASTDDPEAWRNALPPDRVPIVLTFNKDNATEHGYAPVAAPAAEYNHLPSYKYIGADEAGRHQFINTVTRAHKTNKEDVTVGHELIVLVGEGKFISLYLGNDGKTEGLPTQFREVRLNKDLKTTYDQVATDISKAILAAVTAGDIQKAEGLFEPLNNYLRHYKNLTAAKL